MNTRNLGYLGAGVLLAIIIVTLLGVPPAVWITAALLTIVAGGVLAAAHLARHDGRVVAARMHARSLNGASRPVATETTPPPAETRAPAHPRPVDVELVREADDAMEVPAVWLHRCGGRRVHRFAGADDWWTVQQVSTKDPDNPKLRVIGQPRVFADETAAIRAAEEMARGTTATTPPKAMQAPRQVLAAAEG